MRYGDPIKTPNGPGTFAGWLMLEENGVVYVLVRHNVVMLPENPTGLRITPEAQWTVLYAYTDEEIKC